MKDIRLCLYALFAGILVTIITVVLGKALDNMAEYNESHYNGYYTENINSEDRFDENDNKEAELICSADSVDI